MITRGDIQDVYGVGDIYGLGDINGFWGKVKSGVKKGASVVTAPVRGAIYIGQHANEVGKGIVKAATFIPNSALSLGTGIVKQSFATAGHITGTALGIPFGAARMLGSGIASGFKGAAAGARSGSAPSAQDQATAAAAANVLAQQQQAGYDTSPAAGYGGGGGYGGDVGQSSSTLTADPTGAGGPPAPSTLSEKFATMSPLMKIALLGGIGGAGYLFLKRRRGGGVAPRSKS